MASKKYSFLLGVLCLMAVYGFSQTTTIAGYSVTDSSVIPNKRMPQHTEFLNGTYSYPAKPRNQWEVGVKGGAAFISGDVASRFGYGFGAHIRKSLGYIFSMRLEYMNGTNKGLNWVASENYGYNPAWNKNYKYNGSGSPIQKVFYNYKTKIQDLSLQGIVTLNNIRFHKAKTGVNIYALAGVGGMIYDARVNALNGTTPYTSEFASITNNNIYKDRKDVRSALKDKMDDSYETPAENQGERRPKLFGDTFKPSATVGAGLAIKLGKRVNLALEHRFNFTNDDLLDGQRWAEQTPGSPVLTRDFDSYHYTTLGLNFNLGANAVEPLYWLNPLNYAYDEINKARFVKPVTGPSDSDGDGVADQFDREQTPAGCPVDSHGVSLDTDGDGVPDCRDKEKITPTICQPVDADGVGKCPCPEGCKVITDDKGDCSAKLGALPSVTFSGSAVRLSNDAKSLLASAASRIRNNSECRIVVIGYCSSTKAEQQRSWDRVNAVINYLVEQEGINSDRLIFQYGQEGGDCNTVDLRAASSGEQGPTTVPAPHPNLRKN